MIPKSEALPFKIKKNLQIIGLWREDRALIKYIIARIAIFCYFTIYLTQAIDLVMAKDDMQRFFECFSVISFCGMGILKLYSLTCRNPLWLNILKLMESLEQIQLKYKDESDAEYHSDDEGDECSRKAIEKYTDTYNKTSSILSKIYYFTVFIFMTSPFLEYGFKMLRGIYVDKYPHILPSWNPLDNVNFIFYMLTIIFEIVAASYCLIVHLAFDCTSIGVMTLICGQFTLLVFKSERIGGSGMLCNLSKSSDPTAHKTIINCHRVHIQLISTITQLDHLLRNILGVYFLLAALTLCSVAVRLKSESMSTMELVSLLQYMGATLTQLYIYCSYGDAVYTKSSIKQGEGPFAAALWRLSPKARKELVILGFGMMLPKRLHAGPFNTVDLPSFIQIVRAAYSYYAVLSKTK